MKKGRWFLSLVLSGCLLLAACAEESVGQQMQNTVVSDTGYIDTLTPKNDFYGYINARNLMDTELEGRNVRGTLYDMDHEVSDQLDAIIDEIAASDEAYAPGTNEQMIHDLYHLAYDFYEGGTDMEEQDAVLVDGIIEKINAVSSLDELLDTWSELIDSYGLYPVVTCSAIPNEYDIEEYVLMISCSFPADLDSLNKSDANAVKQRNGFSDILKKIGVAGEEATNRANDMIYLFFEIAGHTDLAYLTGDKEYTECYNLYSLEEAKKLIGEEWITRLMDSTGMQGRALEKFVIPDPEQLQYFLSVLDEEHLQIWKDSTIMNVLSQSQEFLPDRYGMTERAETTPQKFARRQVKKFLEKQLAEIYAERYFTESKKIYATQMCEQIRDEYYSLINESEWLSKEGKDILCRKLDTMRFFVGCGKPHKVDPDDEKVIGSTMLQTLYNYNKAAVALMADELDDKVESDPFDDMSASTVNACYLPNGNYIVITAAILNKPVFDENADLAWNLGGIGSCIGHEISHAFDSNGVKYDEKGNYNPDRMPKEDIRAFEELQDKAIEYYNGFTVLSSHVNGKLTLGENLADISGVQCMLALLDSKEEWQEFFENYARYWSTLMIDTSAKSRLKRDTHSPSSVRVNAVVACFDEYYEVYDVQEGDPMYVAPEERVRRW